jgi:hypothetical protein
MNAYNFEIQQRKLYNKYWWWALAMNDFSETPYLKLDF